MRIQLIIFIIALLSYSSYSQKFDANSDENCEKAKKSAINDAKNGKYNSITYGLVVRADWEFYDFYSNFIETKYGIILKDGGCFVSNFTKCYTTKMRELVYEKYGNNIFEKAKSEAIKEYKKTKIYIEEIKPKLMSNEVFKDYAQVQPEYEYGQDSLRTFIRSKLFDFNENEGYIKVIFIIEKDGTISNVEIKKGLNDSANKIALEIVKSLNKWKPAQHFDEIVRVSKSQSFNLQNKEYFTKDGKPKKKE